MANSIQLSNRINRPVIPILQEPQLSYVLSELSAPEAHTVQQMPVNAVLVLDQSGSMRGEKIHTLRETVKTIIDQLNPQDTLSIVTFESTPHILIPAQQVSNKAELKSKVGQILEGGGTVLAPALREAFKQVKTFASPNCISRLVLLTDGEVTDQESESFRLADQFGSSGIPIIGLGFGTAWNTDFVQELADRSLQMPPKSRTGYCDYIATPQQALGIFQQVFQSMQVVARSVHLTYRLVQGVEARRVWQVTPMIKEIGGQVIHGSSVVLDVPDIAKNGSAFLIEFLLPPRPAGTVRIAQASLNYQLPNGEPGQSTEDLVVQYSTDPAALNQIDQKVMNVFEKVTAFRLQTQALDEASMGNLTGATQRLRQAVTILLDQGETDLARQMEQEAQNLEHGRSISEEGSKTIRLTSRKTIRLSDD